MTRSTITKLTDLRQTVRAALDRYLAVALGRDRCAAIPVLECISVQTPQGSDLIDTVITHLAEHLA